jgi:hypothetical protein
VYRRTPELHQRDRCFFTSPCRLSSTSVRRSLTPQDDDPHCATGKSAIEINTHQHTKNETPHVTVQRDRFNNKSSMPGRSQNNWGPCSPHHRGGELSMVCESNACGYHTVQSRSSRLNVAKYRRTFGVSKKRFHHSCSPSNRQTDNGSGWLMTEAKCFLRNLQFHELSSANGALVALDPQPSKSIAPDTPKCKVQLNS